MKAIILAAGYATRLYPLTINTPKALLPLGKETILDFVVNEIKTISEIDEIFIVTNEKFYKQFSDWNIKNNNIRITIINDNTTEDANKLGAIGDIQYVINKQNIKEDILVIASDNVFTFNLIDFYHEFKTTQKDMVLISHIDNKNDLKRMANVVIDKQGKILNIVEKPFIPISNTVAYAVYFYTKDTINMFEDYLRQGNNPDSPGYFIEWLYKKKNVYTYRFNGDFFDIGTPSAYNEVKNIKEFETYEKIQDGSCMA